MLSCPGRARANVLRQDLRKQHKEKSAVRIQEREEEELKRNQVKRQTDHTGSLRTTVKTVIIRQTGSYGKVVCAGFDHVLFDPTVSGGYPPKVS